MLTMLGHDLSPFHHVDDMLDKLMAYASSTHIIVHLSPAVADKQQGSLPHWHSDTSSTQ